MARMKPRLIALTLGALAVLVVSVVIRSSNALIDDAPQPSTARSETPSFEVRVVKSRMSRPVFGILPSHLFDEPGVFTFDDASPGAALGSVGPERVELRADGWDLTVAADIEGRVAPETYLVFSLHLGGKDQTLRCRPGESGQGPVDRVREALGFAARPREETEAPDFGNLTTELTPAGIRGRFRVELAVCENATTRQRINWPPGPLTVVGAFRGGPKGSS